VKELEAWKKKGVNVGGEGKDSNSLKIDRRDS